MPYETTQYTVVGIGELLWDLLPKGRQLGGAPANFAYNAQQLCGSGFIVSCVATDELGAEALALLSRHELSTEFIARDHQHATGTVSVSLNDAGVPSYTIREDAAWDYVPETPSLLELAWESDAICFGSLAQRSSMTRETIHAFLRAANPDCLKIFDINLRQAYYNEFMIRESLGRANVLKLNEDELPVLQAMFRLDEKENDALKQLLENFGLNLIALTKGENGALMVSTDEEIFQAGLAPETIADTVGAGDAFTAAMTVGLLQGHALARICADANQLASYICSQQGAMPPIPGTLIAR